MPSEEPTATPLPTRVRTSGAPETTQVSTVDCVGIISAWDPNCAYTDATACDADWMCQWNGPGDETWMPSTLPTQTPAEMPSARRRTTEEPTSMPTPTPVTTTEVPETSTTEQPTSLPSPETTETSYLEPDSGLLDSIQRLLERNFTESRMISVGQRASALLQEKDESGAKLAQQYDPDVKGHLQTLRRLWKSDDLGEENWIKMINRYNRIADILGRTRVE